MEIHFLDVGPKPFGDSILCRHNGGLILIDGGHPNNDQARDDGKRKSIPDQIAAITKKKGPWKLDLLVVTHAHLDHTGCLSKLVNNGTLTAKWALVADEKFGWGRHQGHDAAMDAALPDTVKRLAAGLREDMVPDLTDAAAVRDFLDAAAGQEASYSAMLAKLAKDGTKVVRYGRTPHAKLLTAFNKWNLKILGPSKPHLKKCADAVAAKMSDAFDFAATLHRDAPGAPDAETLYIGFMRDLSTRERDSMDSMDSGSDRPGAALNDMSIVLTLGPAGRKVLLAGDMQYRAPGVPGLDADMKALRAATKKAGPYTVAKTCHHTSHNAAGMDLFQEWGARVLLVHSGGEKNDAKHPDPGVLEELRARAATHPNLWARNDRNHTVSCVINDTTGKLTVKKTAGSLDDFTRNFDNTDKSPPPRPPEAETRPPVVSAGTADDHVEVVIRIPHVTTRVTVTVDVSPGQQSDGPPQSSGGGPVELPLTEQPATLGRRFRGPLLVVTCRPELAKMVGAPAAARAVTMLREAGATVVDTLPPPSSGVAAVLAAVRAELPKEKWMGVVILGGPDVVPLVRLDTLDADRRQQIRDLHLAPDEEDPDDFIVWSDHPYGDMEEDGPSNPGDAISEFPVSRVPDGGSAALLLRLLATQPAAPESRFGLRNLQRPFADKVFATASSASCRTSAPAGPRDTRPGEVAAAGVYLMLHGSYADASVFWGEEEDHSHVPAFDFSNLPPVCPGSVVLCGCCWGAMIAGSPASVPGSKASRTARDSLALAFLERGAASFVGCTGAHYSPLVEPYQHFGGPLHASFWNALQGGYPPALSLYMARDRYLEDFPHGRQGVFGQAIELKTFLQFSCLGLGW